MNLSKVSSIFSRRLLLFMGAMILANIAGQMYQPLMPLFIQSLGANVGQIGLFFTLGAIAPLFFQIFGGWLSDSIGRLQAVAIGSVAGLLSYMVYVLAPSWEWLLLSTIAGAVAQSFVAPSYLAFLAEESDDENRGRVYGVTNSLYMIVGVVGPPLGGVLSEAFGFRFMFVIAGLLHLIATVFRLVMARHAREIELKEGETPNLASLKKSLFTMFAMVTAGGMLTWLMISDGVRDIASSLTFQLQPLYMQNLMGLSNTQIGLLSSLSSFATMLLMTPAGWLADKKGERVGIVSGFAIIALGLAIFLNASVFTGFAVVWILFGIGSALIDPAYNALISKVVPRKLRGTAFGLFSSSLGIISLPAPYIGGFLWERYSPQTPFYVPLIAALVLLPILWIKFKLPPAVEPEGTPS